MLGTLGRGQAKASRSCPLEQGCIVSLAAFQKWLSGSTGHNPSNNPWVSGPEINSHRGLLILWQLNVFHFIADDLKSLLSWLRKPSADWTSLTRGGMGALEDMKGGMAYGTAMLKENKLKKPCSYSPSLALVDLLLNSGFLKNVSFFWGDPK